MGGGKGGGRTSPTSPGRPSIGFPSTMQNPTTFISGKVTIDDGTPLTSPAAVQTICRGVKRTEAYTDSHGNFSFQFSAQLNGSAGDVMSDSSNNSPDVVLGRSQTRDFRECELKASLPGFISETIQLGSRMNFSQSNDIGHVALHRMSEVDGFTVSATSGQAPDKAKKALKKGQDQAKKGKWDEAERELKKAVQEFDRFAVAWYELGRVQLELNEVEPAHASFRQALEADPRYVSPYLELTQLAVQDKQWPVVLDLTGKMLALNPVNFPSMWFYQASANYFLGNFAAAEKSARQTIQLDEEHRIPKAEYMLAIILVQQRSYTDAAQHMRNYLRRAPKGEGTELATRQLAEIERLSSVAVADAKK
jgi:tetratricopeptide (TPR) repeat protein